MTEPSGGGIKVPGRRNVLSVDGKSPRSILIPSGVVKKRLTCQIKGVEVFERTVVSARGEEPVPWRAASERRFSELRLYFYRLAWQPVLLRDSHAGLINWFLQRSRNPCEHQSFCRYKAELQGAGCALGSVPARFLTVEKPRSF